ncbi:phage protein [Lacticaseibacillus rhamnosus]|nr:phage protein [Lacticaseibacillus rhamnosus]
MYLIKNDHGEYLTVERTATWWNSPVGTVVRNIDVALAWAEKYGGHVVTLVEEPEKVVLTKEQAEIVEGAHDFEFPASYISRCDEDEELLMNAYVNDYTVAKEKKYNVKVPHTKEVWYYKSGDTDLLTICPADKELRGKFTEAEIEHYGLQYCEKEEVTDDDE